MALVTTANASHGINGASGGLGIGMDFSGYGTNARGGVGGIIGRMDATTNLESNQILTSQFLRPDVSV